MTIYFFTFFQTFYDKIRKRSDNLKQETFHIGDYGRWYDDTDYLNPDDLENIEGDNLFLAFIEDEQEVEFAIIMAIHNQIYNFNTHKFLPPTTNIRYARAFSDIMPREIWRPVHITNYDIISIDVDDDKAYIIEQFEETFTEKTDEQAKSKVLRNQYKPK